MHKGEVWNQAKAAYQRGEGSIRVLAERFGLSEGALRTRCHRGQWQKEKKEIGEIVHQHVVSTLAEEQKARLRRMIGGFDKDNERIEECFAQLEPAADPVALKCLVQSRKTIVDGFQALGAIPIFQPQMASGSLSSDDVLGLLLKVSAMSDTQREKLKALPDPDTIDIEVVQ